MSGTLPLSLCVITRDAAAMLAECLASAPFAGEIVVVDSGSRDDTVEIARRRGARVIERDWPGFGAQKNFAVGAATHDWVLCLDADERVTPELAAAIARRDERTECGALTRWRAATASSAAGSRTARAIRTGTCGCSIAAARAGAPIRCTSTSSPTVRSRASPATCCTRRRSRSTPTSRSRIATRRCRRKRCTRAASAPASRGSCCRPLARFLRFYVLRLGFLDGVAGFVHIAIGAFASFLKYAKLRALTAEPRR